MWRVGANDLDRILKRVAEILETQPDKILSNGKNRLEAVARRLVCFLVERDLRATTPRIGPPLGNDCARYWANAGRKGEQTVRENHGGLLKSVSYSNRHKH
jgi:hypothetical protein